MPTTSYLSKDDELTRLDAWISELPADSYLRLYFGDATVRNEFAWCIRNDFGAPYLHGVRKTVVEAREQAAEARREVERAKQELATAQGTLATLRRRIDDARMKCSEAGSAMEFLFATVRHLSS